MIDKLLDDLYKKYMIGREVTDIYHKHLYDKVEDDPKRINYKHWLNMGHSNYEQNYDGYKEFLFDRIIAHQAGTNIVYNLNFIGFDIYADIPDVPFVVKIKRVFYFCKNYRITLQLSNDQYFVSKDYEDTTGYNSFYEHLCRSLEGYIIEFENLEELSKKCKLVKKNKNIEIYDINSYVKSP